MDVFGEETSNEAYVIRPGTHDCRGGSSTTALLTCSLAQKNYEPRPPIIRTLGFAPSAEAAVLTSAIGNTF